VCCTKLKWVLEETLQELRSAQLNIKVLQREANVNDEAGPWSTIQETGKELKTRN
jgi:hypothetical protein